jgi:ubiquinone/menaquinone biosynthesis C-methylase UbiE
MRWLFFLRDFDPPANTEFFPVNYFLQIYGTLPRAGPGSNELTRKAFEMMLALPDSPRILDVGCGPGMQTVELLRIGAGTVLALDFLPEMIDRVNAKAVSAGVSDRLETMVKDMREMDFPVSSFDIIWSEGAIYNLGFEVGLKKFQEFIRPGGYIAVSEAVWLKPNPPSEVVELWREYTEIDTVAAKLEIIKRSGYEVVGPNGRTHCGEGEGLDGRARG